MDYIHENQTDTELSFTVINSDSLRADCDNCFGFCCAALYFSALEGFPVDKDAGVPCPNLQHDFRCRVHENLWKLGLKGCIAYDCFGAGQKVAQITFRGHDWRETPESARQMYDVFLVMRQIHEMLWYLKEALTLNQASHIHGELNTIFNGTGSLTFQSADALMGLDVAAHRKEVNRLLLKTSEMVRSNILSVQKTPPFRRRTLGGALDLIGADLRKKDLRGANFRGVYLMAADLRGVDLNGVDFIGADLRDADLRGADLTCSIFLTQAQINSAKGDSGTKLPVSLTRPIYWSKY